MNIKHSKKMFAKELDRVIKDTKFCFTQDCTNKPIQKCHVLAESSQLSNLITSHNDYVAIIKPGAHQIFFGNRENLWRFLKIGSALTFYGFCNPCDNSLFSNADDACDLNVQFVNELNLRAFYYNSWHKHVDVRTIENVLRARNTDFRDVPPILVPRSKFIRNFAEERVYLGWTMAASIEKLRDHRSTGETNFINYAFEVEENLAYYFSGVVYLTSNLMCGVRPLDWNTSVEMPVWFIHLLKVKNKTHLIFSFEEKFQAIVENEISFVEKLDPEERARVLVQYFIINNMGFVCSSKLANDINNSQYFRKILHKEYLRLEGNQATENLRIPTSDFPVGALTIGSRIDIK